MNRLLKWTGFALLCLVSWAAAGLFLLTSGWASCTVTGWCAVDRIAFIVIVLLLPSEVATAAYMRHREKEREGRS